MAAKYLLSRHQALRRAEQQRLGPDPNTSFCCRGSWTRRPQHGPQGSLCTLASHLTNRSLLPRSRLSLQGFPLASRKNDMRSGGPWKREGMLWILNNAYRTLDSGSWT